MRVTVSLADRFWGFHQAEQLQRRGALARLITTQYDPRRDRIERERVVWNPRPEWAGRCIRHCPGLKHIMEFGAVKDIWFGRWAARQVPPCDIFVGYSNYALESLRAAKGLGAITLLEAGTMHTEQVDALLLEEFARWGVRPPAMSQRLRERKLKEYAEADYIVTPSVMTAKSFLQKGHASSRLLTFHLGVDIGDFRPTPKADNVFRVLYVGGLTLRKGVVYLLEAVQGLRLPKLEVLLIGRLYDEFKGIARRFAGSFRHIPWVSHTELFALYSQASVFVLPSVEDAFGMVLTEAMACGLPAIVSDQAGGAEIITEGVDGFVVPARDSTAIRERLLLLATDEPRRQAVAEAAQAKARTFTWDRYGEALVQTYTKLLAARERGH
jgi:glycosyltransferase involved in cell wall biosynthesis